MDKPTPEQVRQHEQVEALIALRKEHPDQERIDRESAQALRDGLAYTPETLRELALHGDPDGIAKLLAHADAWEADRQRLEEAEKEIHAALVWWEDVRGGDEMDAANFAGVVMGRFAAFAKDTITDDLGNTWSATCKCGGKMSVVRPGKAQCENCG